MKTIFDFYRVAFTKADFLQSTHLDFCAIILFTTCFAVINLLSVLFLHLKQYVSCFLTYTLKKLPSRFLVTHFTNHFYEVASIFLTMDFKHFDFIEWFELNSYFSNLLAIFSDFLVYFSMCLYILFISLKMLNFFSIRINSNKHTIKFFF